MKKKKTILALQAPANRGKTTTIGILYERMINNGYGIILPKRIRNSHDFSSILQRDGIIIGITTYGDNVAFLRGILNRFSDAQCAIIVCACHDIGTGMYELVRTFPGYTSEFFQKTLANNIRQRAAVNNIDTETLLNRIEELLP